MTPQIAVEWWALFFHFFALSLMAVGGAITTVPEMHRFLVADRAWLTDSQFTSSIALAQAAPGPNILFVALMGWNVGLNAAGGMAVGWHALWFASAGLLLPMLGILLPSTTLTFMVARWAHQNRELRAVRAFKVGMAPIVIALLVATAWILAYNQKSPTHPYALWLVTAMCAILVWKTRLHILWLLAAGGLLGWLGLI
jgi:chromate transporter